MNRLIVFYVMAVLLINQSMVGINAQVNKFGLFEDHSDVGNVKLKGSAEFDSANQLYSLKSSGKNIWFDQDEFHFLFRKLKGDFIVRSKIKFMGPGVELHRKAGWMIRESLKSNAAMVSAVVHGNGLTSLQFRNYSGDSIKEKKSLQKSPDVIQMERKGNKFIMSTAVYGEPFIFSDTIEVNLEVDVFIGLFVCAHNPDVIEKVLFNDVRIVIPVKEGYIPYKDYIGSNIEVFDLQKSQSKVILSSQLAFEAPNWTSDNRYLIVNSKGLLYSIKLDNLKMNLIPTGFANRNNNDHVLSSDNAFIGISHHAPEDNGNSLIYIIPITGGTPLKVTSQGPSYLHGWSPDNQFLIYTGSRNGQFEIYKISVHGGKEIQLTSAKGLNDGSEYSPDGKYIYFHSDRTGKMEIWRMNADGSEQIQITKDSLGLNNWFPHISPDGKWIVFLSYMGNVASDQHPYYKQVYLRMMPVKGGQAKVISYLYGGQGTMNVSSWSSDSQMFAFVSNSDVIE